MQNTALDSSRQALYSSLLEILIIMFFTKTVPLLIKLYPVVPVLTNILKVSLFLLLLSIYATINRLVVNRSLSNKEANISNDLPSLAT